MGSTSHRVHTSPCGLGRFHAERRHYRARGSTGSFQSSHEGFCMYSSKTGVCQRTSSESRTVSGTSRCPGTSPSLRDSLSTSPVCMRGNRVFMSTSSLFCTRFCADCLVFLRFLSDPVFDGVDERLEKAVVYACSFFLSLFSRLRLLQPES